MVRIKINDRHFQLTEKGLEVLNSFMKSADCTALEEKWNAQKQTYSYVPSEVQVQLEIKTVTEWK